MRRMQGRFRYKVRPQEPEQLQYKQAVPAIFNKGDSMKLRILVLLLLATPLFAHDVALTWTPGTGGGSVTGYNVKRSSVKGGPYTTVQAVPSTQSTFDDTATAIQTEGVHFFYVISATGPGGESVNS